MKTLLPIRNVRRRKLLALAGLLVLGTSVGAAAPTGSAPSFASPRYYTTPKAPESLAIGDLNGDGKPDLVAAHGYYGSFPRLRHLRAVSVLLNTGDGSFGAAHAYPTGKEGDEHGAWSVAIGDLNGDGEPDLATANPGGRSVSVLINRGEGSFEASVNHPIAREPWDVAIRDLNGDAKLDVATANPNTVSVLLNRGDGSFEDELDYPTGRDTYAFAVGDLNDDGKPDLATANRRPSTVSVLINRGDGSFEPRLDHRVGPGPVSIAVGDLNGDRKPDLVTVNGSSIPGGDWFDSISVLHNRGDGTFRAKQDYRAQSCDPYESCDRLEFSSVAIGDLNGDRKADVATANVGPRARLVSVLASTGSGRLRLRLDYGPEAGERAGYGARSIAIGDLTGDRRLDLVTPQWRSVSVLVNKPGRCTVQDVRSKTLRAARRTIGRANCRVGRIRLAYSVSVLKGRVAAQRPAGGAVLPGRGKIDLVVSRGRMR